MALVVVAGCGRIGFDGLSQHVDTDATAADGPVSDGDTSIPARVTYLKASNTESFDNFGFAIALSRDGGTLAVSAMQEDSSATGIDGSQTSNGAPQSGAVYVFVRSGTTWVQQAYLKPANTGGGDVFGWSLALSNDGNRLVVGAPLEDSASVGVDNASGDVTATYDGGAAYAFGRSGNTWAQQAYLKPSNTDAGDDFGVAVAISGDGNTIAVGAGHEDSPSIGIGQNQAQNTATDAGAVYVFRFGSAWTQEAYVKASNTNAGDDFGGSVALSTDGNTLAVGAASEDSGAITIGGDQTDNGVTEAGAVYVFTRNTTDWSQQAYIKPSQIDFGDYFGKRLALSSDGNTLAVAAPGNDATVANSGAAFVYGRSGTTWSELLMLKAPNADDNDQLGFDIAISGGSDTVMVGTGFEDSAGTGVTADPDDDTGTDCGAAYVWGRTGAGAPYTFAAYVKPPVSSLGDQFGASVALSYDHLTAAIAMPFEDSNATGVNMSATDESADASGAVYIFEY